MRPLQLKTQGTGVEDDRRGRLLFLSFLYVFSHSLTISTASFCAPIPLRWKTTPSIPLIRGTA